MIGLNLLHDLSYTARMLHRELQKKLENYDLHWGQPKLLNFLEVHDGSTQHEIGEWLDLRPATLTRMVGRMEESGYLRREKDARDKRIVRVYLTDKARRTNQELRREMDLYEQEAFSDFSESDRELMRHWLGRIRENIRAEEPRCRRGKRGQSL